MHILSWNMDGRKEVDRKKERKKEREEYENGDMNEKKRRSSIVDRYNNQITMC